MRFYQNPASEVGSNIDKLYGYIFFKKKKRYKISGISGKSQSQKIHRSTFEYIKYISIVVL